jgi:2-polyprenyl-3-methyl-5-hydroxy-6-metoxy-1,4-benzoquinol methylase
VESAELIAILREVRERVRAQHAQGSVPGNTPLPDLMPLAHARDRAMGKVAGIGVVNPRRGGPVNALIQAGKRVIARLLEWHVREQVVFNRNAMECIDAAAEAFSDNNRAISALAAAIDRVRTEIQEVAERIVASVAAVTTGQAQELNDIRKHGARQAQDFDDIRKHWAEWRSGWEHKLAENEVQFLRSVADLQGAFQHRVTLMDTSYRESVRAQHRDFEGALAKGMNEIFANVERMRLEYERLIHTELRLVRQRLEPVAQGPALCKAEPCATQPGGFDYGRFAERFRGSEEYVKAGQQFYLPYFRNCRNVLDIGCGRGEFLEILRAAGVPSRGIDLSAECAARCRQKGLDAEVADLFAYLAEQSEACFDGIFCAQVVEHLPPERLPEMLKLAVTRLQPGGVIAIEAPNPECLAIFASHFYLDPTHSRPVPYPLLVFYLEEFGVGALEVKRLSPAVGSMPSVASLPAEFREAFFGGLDYAVIGKKL